MHGLDWYDYGARYYDAVISQFTTIDPLAEKYYSISPYAYCAGNPVMFVDPDGRSFTKYEDEDGNELLNTNDGSKAVVVVKQAQEKGFEAAVRGTRNTDDVAWNQAMKNSLTGIDFTSKHEALLGSMNSDASRRAAIQFWQSGNGSDYMKFVAIETASQWTNPSLVIGGLSVGVAGLGVRPQFTKSNLKFGQAMHRAYRRDLHNPSIGMYKEYRLPSGNRIDFLDVKNGYIYELKPNNPRAIKQGNQQLDKYLKELNSMPKFQDVNWQKKLDTY